MISYTNCAENSDFSFSVLDVAFGGLWSFISYFPSILSTHGDITRLARLRPLARLARLRPLARLVRLRPLTRLARLRPLTRLARLRPLARLACLRPLDCSKCYLYEASKRSKRVESPNCCS